MSFPAIFPNHQLPRHHPLGPEAPLPRPTPSSATASKMAPRACVMTRPSVRRKCAQRLQGTGGLGVWCPELRELGGAAARWSRRAAATMVFYFTSSGEWAPRAPGPLLHGASPKPGPPAVAELGPRWKAPPPRRLPLPAPSGPLCCSSVWSPSECLLPGAWGARRGSLPRPPPPAARPAVLAPGVFSGWPPVVTWNWAVWGLLFTSFQDPLPPPLPVAFSLAVPWSLCTLIF